MKKERMSERCKRYMEKLNTPGNEHLLQKFKENHKVHAKRYRLRQLADPELAKKYRAREAAKKRNARARRSELENNSGSHQQAKVLKTPKIKIKEQKVVKKILPTKPEAKIKAEDLALYLKGKLKNPNMENSSDREAHIISLMEQNLNLCRICGEPEAEEKHVNIYETDGQIAQRIYTLTGVTVCIMLNCRQSVH